ncbi:YdcF family protein [Pasteurella sp. PK-2025]|uniref:YdcF family protein n=1 Tax=unclassified Pasteurella TaxID=2621516 RepID=UPI003C717B97
MFALTKLITVILLPPFNVILLWFFAFLFSFFHYKKLSRCCAVLGFFILYLSSIPYMAQKLEDSLVTEDNLTLADYQQAQAIVLLGGGIRDSKELYAKLAVNAIPLERVRYAAYLQKQTHLPLLISGSSGAPLSEAEVAAMELRDFFHVPTQWLEPKARNTKENAQYSAEILKKEGIHKIILVTNQWHMKRATLLFERQGFEVLPASVGSGETPEVYSIGMWHFIPQAGVINKNMLLLKEWLGYLKEK